MSGQRSPIGAIAARCWVGAAALACTLPKSDEDLPGSIPEYLALVDPDSFEPLTRLDGPAVLAVAARVGPVRLIDNIPLEPVGAPVATG